MTFHNLARVASATTGTGTLTLGAAVDGFLTFADAGVTDGELVYYSIRDGSASEVGRGTYTASGTTLSRDTIYLSTNSGAAINCSGSQEVFITVLAESANLIDPYQIFHRAGATDSDDDEFSDATIDAAYTQVNPTGSVTWVEANHVMSALFSGQSTSDMAAILKATTLADGEAYETTLQVLAKELTNYTMAGLIITDGTTSTSNAIAFIAYWDNSTRDIIFEIRTGTLTNLATGATSYVADAGTVLGKVRMRLKRNSSSSFSALIGLDSGAQYSAFGMGNVNPGFTPTHAGLCASVWGGAQTGMAAWDFFRVVPP